MAGDEIGLNHLGHLTIGDGGICRCNLGDESRFLGSTSFGNMEGVACPADPVFGTVPGIQIIGRSNHGAGWRKSMRLFVTPITLTTCPVILLYPDLSQHLNG